MSSPVTARAGTSLPLARVASLLATIAAVACAGRPSRLPTPAPRVADANVSPPAAPRARPYGHPPLRPDVARACESLAKRNVEDADALALRPYLRKLATICLPTQNGAWAFRIEKDPTGAWRPPVALVHLGADGRVDRTSAADLLDIGSDCNSFGDDRVVVQPVADYDGDGENEVFLGVEQYGSHRAQCSSARIFALRDEGVGEVAVPGQLRDVQDFDEDGLEDLLVDLFVADVPDCYGHDARERGLPLLAHALPDGSFSMADEVARRYARGQCPSLPTNLAGNVECARLWGVSADGIHAAIAQREAECLDALRETQGPDTTGCMQLGCSERSASTFAAVEVPLDLSK
jgi:hypothetical protein